MFDIKGVGQFFFWIGTYVYAWKFKGYARYPITIFNTMFKIIFTFIILIAFVTYDPSMFLLKPESIPLLSYLSPLLDVAFFWLNYKLWMKGASTYSGAGS